MKPIRVLSLFDGISCGQLALQRAGIPVAVYYASEIEKASIQVTQKNFPNTVQLGDVTKIDFTKYAGQIDLLIGGSPCQDLSIAGQRAGLDGARSGLFFKYLEALHTIKPTYFLLENNVGMPQAAYEKISELMGCYPVEINSALVSAQNRRRYYWTNIGPKNYDLFGFPTCAIPQPEDKKILLKDILEQEPSLKLDPNLAHYLRDFGTKGKIMNEQQPKVPTLTAAMGMGGGNVPCIAYQDKSHCLTASYRYGISFEHDFPKQKNTMIAEPMPCAMRNWGDGKQPEFNKTNKANALTTVATDSMVCEPICVNLYNGRITTDKTGALGTKTDLSCITSNAIVEQPAENKKIYEVRAGKISLKNGADARTYNIDLPDGQYSIRKLTPVECERLQTLPDNYTNCVSKTNRYAAIGNGWTVDVIAHIFSFIKTEDKQ